MPKKIITIEIDTDEISNALKYKDNLSLKLTVASNDNINNTTNEHTHLSPEDVKAIEKEVGWPF